MSNRAYKQFVASGKISRSDFDFLSELDPSDKKKYLPFIVKSYLENVNLDLLTNRVIEYDTLVKRNLVGQCDILRFKNFAQFDSYVIESRNIKSQREIRKQAKSDAEIVLNTEDLIIVRPKTHQASCFYGAGTKWCTIADSNVYFNYYLFEQRITLYYLQVKSLEMKSKLGPNLHKVAFVVRPNMDISVFDASDKRIFRGNPFTQLDRSYNLNLLRRNYNLDLSLFRPKSINERMPDLITHYIHKGYEELNLFGTGLRSLVDEIGNSTQLKSLILSENNLKEIPETIGNLLKLETLHLFNNQLTDLPSSIENLVNLKWLGLSGNEIRPKTVRYLKRKLPNTRIYFEKLNDL